MSTITRIRPRRLIRQRWRAVSASIVRHNDLPHGCVIRLWDTRKSRWARDDLIVTRARFGAALHGGDETVGDLLNRVVGICLTDLKARGFELYFFEPDGTQRNRRRKLATARKQPPKPTPAEVTAAAAREALRQELADQFEEAMTDISSPDHDELDEVRACLRALASRYGPALVGQARCLEGLG